MSEPITITCLVCRGSTTQDVRHQSGDPELETVEPCEACKGTGEAQVTAEQIDELVRAAGVALSSMATVSVAHPKLIPSYPVVGLRDALRDMGGDV
jgi:DnaJ-class molecular chaperone